jgi:hypothetical protein
MLRVIALSAFLTCCLGTVVVQADILEPVVAFDNATIQPAGPRTGSGGKAFLNVQGVDNAQFASFGVIDFQFGPQQTPVASVQSLQLNLTQTNAAFSRPGALRFWLTEQNDIDIQPGTSPLVFDADSPPAGVGNQFQAATLYDLGTGSYEVIATDTVDQFVFNISNAAVSTYLTQQLNSAGVIRMLVTPDDATVSATYGGYTNNTAGRRPTLSLTVTAVPEPSSMVLASLAVAGGLGWIGRRRWKGNGDQQRG